MRKASMKRKSGRKSSVAAYDKQNDGDASLEDTNVNGQDADNDVDETEDTEPEPPKKRRSDKRKSVSFSSKQQEDSEEEEEYEVEAVVDQKVVKGVKQYLIRWKGFGPEGDTWEPENTLNCNELIEEFLSGSSKSKKGRPPKAKGKKTKTDSDKADWSENEEFEVDRILEVHHKRDGSREFLVSWKGFPPSDNSWEPEENMTCQDLIERFMKKVEKAKVVDTKELRQKPTHTNRFTLSYNDRGRRLSKRNQGKQRVQYHDAE